MVIGDSRPADRAITLRIHARADGRFQVRDGDFIFGTSQNEMLAVWTAVMAADELAKSGSTVRVVRNAQGRDIEEYVARGRRRI
jgi:hypothetical protein